MLKHLMDELVGAKWVDGKWDCLAHAKCAIPPAVKKRLELAFKYGFCDKDRKSLCDIVKVLGKNRGCEGGSSCLFKQCTKYRAKNNETRLAETQLFINGITQYKGMRPWLPKNARPPADATAAEPR